MAHVALSLPAEKDLDAIWSYIAKDNRPAADQLVRRIHERCQLYATQPAAGTLDNRFQSGLRYFSVASYVLFYRPADDGLVVVRVLHGARNIEDLFRT
ncbi:MAG TPA: type II toxin-antitoxin system RelE/ParE family toxin [Pirellulales bacterium]|jgi:toxin ParE1/3/4|nr:type II toxin-antitoxin system RelE/ParE family toxin [Pirellulales bacterium]